MLIVVCDALWGDSQAFFVPKTEWGTTVVPRFFLPPAVGDENCGFLARGRVRRFLFFAFTLHRMPIYRSVSTHCV